MLTRRTFLQTLTAAWAASLLAACSARGTAEPEQGPEAEHELEPEPDSEPEQGLTADEAPDGEAPVEPDAPAAAGALVVFFSHAGENYQVGMVEEGNTAIVAGMIAERTGADTFEIVPMEAYPEGYDDCCDVALAEQGEGARPAYEGEVDLAPYSTIYLGYPIWWGDLPMVVYTFLEAHDWTGKTILPFCTHGGSGLAGTEASISETCVEAGVLPGLAISGATAQNDRAAAEADVDAWLG